MRERVRRVAELHHLAGAIEVPDVDLTFLADRLARRLDDPLDAREHEHDALVATDLEDLERAWLEQLRERLEERRDARLVASRREPGHVVGCGAVLPRHALVEVLEDRGDVALAERRIDAVNDVDGLHCAHVAVRRRNSVWAFVPIRVQVPELRALSRSDTTARMVGAGPTVRLAELFGAFGLFADLADGFADEKVIRTVVIAMRIAHAARIPEAELRDVYYASLLRYAGCVGFSHEEAHHYGGGDDISVRSAMALADPTDPVATVRRIVQRVGQGRPLFDRARAVARLLGDKSAVARHSRAQCDTAMWMARIVGSSPPVLEALSQICERFDGRGAPRGVAGGDLRRSMRLHHIADVAEIVFHREGVEAALAETSRRAGKHLDPDLTRFVGAATFDGLDGPSVWEEFLGAEPVPHATATGREVDAVARAFGALADLKSVYTIGHSARVARFAKGAAEVLGLDAALAERAGHLHDLGRVAIPNWIWDKPERLSVAERERVQMHAYYTDRILRRAGALGTVAQVAAAAHERSNRAGYPKGETPSPLADVLAAADVFAALGEERPHRPAFGEADAKRELARMAVAGELAPRAVEATLHVAGLGAAPLPLAEHTLTAREVEVLRHLARGKSNREIGALLGISARTVQNHVAHVYDKLGLYSRAGATLWAVERGLLL